MSILALTLILAVLVVFRPLLVGLVRAAILVVRPRLTREQQLERAHLRDLRVLQRAINASSCPSHAAELRALAARS